MELTNRKKTGSYYFVVQQGAPRVPGGDTRVLIFAAFEGEGVPVLTRTLYFDERTASHADNFRQKFAFDSQYREMCLLGTAHWCRVARLYELNAGILVEDRMRRGKNPVQACRTLFHFIRRDLKRIESLPEYRSEMARQSRGKETALEDALNLLSKIPGLKVASLCQGSTAVQVGGKIIFLPSCHSDRATIAFESVPEAFLRYLRTGPLSQTHLAAFSENRISSARVIRNAAFIRTLSRATGSYLSRRISRNAGRQSKKTRKVRAAAEQTAMFD